MAKRLTKQEKAEKVAEVKADKLEAKVAAAEAAKPKTHEDRFPTEKHAL